MRKPTLGRSGLEVSAIGLGYGHKLHYAYALDIKEMMTLICRGTG